MAGNSARIHVGVKDDATKPINGIRDAFERVKKEGAKGFAIGAGAAITAKAFNVMGMAIDGATDFMRGSIDAASSLNESLSKSQAVFGDLSGEIERWADTASAAFGQSKQQALEAAGTFGNLFQAFGVGRDEASKMSMSLTELAADLASFNNTSIDDALIALRSGLSGETEPLKRYGVAISDARMRTELMAQGVKNLGSTLTPLQKTTAAYALIMKDTALAQGDFARTSDGLANSSRTLEAKVTDLQAKIGGPLSEAAKVATQAFIDLADGINAATDKAQSFDARVLGTVEGFGGFASVINDLLNPNLVILRENLRGVEKGFDGTSTAAHLAGAEARRAGSGIGRAGQAADDAEPPVRDLRVQAQKLADALDETKDKAEEAADALAEAIYGPAELKGELAELEQQLIDDRKELGRLEAIKNPTAETRRDITATKGRLAETQSEILRTRVQLALLNGTGLDAIVKDLQKLASRTDAAGDEARELLALLRSIQGVKIPAGDRTQRGGYSGYRASGGPVWPGKWMVGEDGPETLVLGASGQGYVVPNAGGGGSPSSGVGSAVVTINVAGPTHPMTTPAAAQAYAREVAPAILDEFRRRGVVV